MKKILNLFIILFLLSPILTSCNNTAKVKSSDSKPKTNEASTKKTPKNKIAIYLVKDMSTSNAKKTSLDKIPLESEPFITEKDIPSYYWRSSIITISETKLNYLLSVTPTDGKPFVLTVNDERIYLGVFWSPDSSVNTPSNIHIIRLSSGADIIDKLENDGYSITPQQGEVPLPTFAPSDWKDSKNEKILYNALKDAGILKE